MYSVVNTQIIRLYKCSKMVEIFFDGKVDD